jgi:hypothetical protein
VNAPAARQPVFSLRKPKRFRASAASVHPTATLYADEAVHWDVLHDPILTKRTVNAVSRWLP